MKTKVLLLLSAIAFAFASCNNKAPEAIELENTCAYPLEMEKYTFSDSSKYANITISIELPVAKDSISQVIRDTLMDIVSYRLRTCQNFEETKPLISKYKGDEQDSKSTFDYYSKAVTRLVNASSKEDNDFREKSYEEDTTSVKDDNYEFSVTPFDYSMTVNKLREDSTYVVFNDNEYAFTGGAHGGVFGFGCVTFRFSDGSKVNGFLKDNVTKAMQPLIKKGLKEFFNEESETPIKSDAQLMEQLMLPDNSGMIPLPVWMPYPHESGKGLAFVYQQYEIACYAAGMPAFVLTWDELKPFLKEEIIEELK